MKVAVSIFGRAASTVEWRLKSLRSRRSDRNVIAGLNPAIHLLRKSVFVKIDGCPDEVRGVDAEPASGEAASEVPWEEMDDRRDIRRTAPHGPNEAFRNPSESSMRSNRWQRK